MSDDYDDRGRPPPPPPPPSGSRRGGAYDDYDAGYGQQSSDWRQPVPGDNRGMQPTGATGWGADQPVGMQPAGVGSRIGAYIIDAILVGIVNAIIGFLIGLPFVEPGDPTSIPFMGTGPGFGVTFLIGVIGAAITLAYFGLLEANDGQTLGKKLLSIRAVKADGSGLELADAVKRRVPFVIGSLIPIPFLGGFIGFAILIAILVTVATDQPWNRGLHDKWADTMVIRA